MGAVFFNRDRCLKSRLQSAPTTTQPEVKAAVKREGNITRYEIGVPVKLMSEIKPEAGREFCFSLTVQDPDGTGPRDLGSVMNLWPGQRQFEFGFCSSIH